MTASARLALLLQYADLLQEWIDNEKAAPHDDRCKVINHLHEIKAQIAELEGKRKIVTTVRGERVYEYYYSETLNDNRGLN